MLKNDMKLIMENWRKNVLIEDEGECESSDWFNELLLENTGAARLTAQEALDQLGQAEQALEKYQSENGRKKWLGKILLNVMALAGASILIPMLAKFFAGIGVAGVFAGSWAGIKALISGQGYSDMIKAAIDKIPPEAWEEIKEQLPGFIEQIKGKVQGVAIVAINKLLDLKDEDAAKSDVLKSIDLPDELVNLVDPGQYKEMLQALKTRINQLISKGRKMPAGGSVAMLNKWFRKEFGVFLVDARFRTVLDR